MNRETGQALISSHNRRQSYYEVALAASLTSLPSTHRGEKAVTKVVLSVEVALDVLPLELILATPSAAHTVPLIAHTLLRFPPDVSHSQGMQPKYRHYNAGAVRVAGEVLLPLQLLHSTCCIGCSDVGSPGDGDCAGSGE